MKLCYRGVSYEPSPTSLVFEDGAIIGRYRGAKWRSRQLQTRLVLHSAQSLKYRGAGYLLGHYHCASPQSSNLICI